MGTNDAAGVSPPPEWPRTRTYVFVLPEPLALPDGYTSLRQRRGLALARVADLMPFVAAPADALVPAAVSLVVRRIPGRDHLTGPLSALDQAVRSTVATFGVSIPPPAADDSEVPDQPQWRSWWTVVEATVLDPGPHGLWDMTTPDPSGGTPDLLTFAHWAVADLVRGYRLATSDLTPDATYRRLFPLVATWTAALDGSDFRGPKRVWLQHTPRLLPNAVTVDDELTAAIENVAWRAENDDPLLVYADRMNAANRAAAVDGDYDIAVLNAAVAAESLLVTTWLATEWERGADPVAIAKQWVRLAGGSVTTVTARLADRLGGDWSLGRNPVVAAWQADLVDVRNRVAHLGEHPSADEVTTALDVPPALLTFVKERVAAAFPAYGRTAFFILGTDDLTARFGKRWVTFREDHDDEPLWYATFATWRADVLARARALRSPSRGSTPSSP